MTYDFDITKYEPELQKWIIQQMDDSMCPMTAGEIYVNSNGKEYFVLEDSPAGEAYVKVKVNCPFGTSTRWIVKAVLLS